MTNLIVLPHAGLLVGSALLIVSLMLAGALASKLLRKTPRPQNRWNVLFDRFLFALSMFWAGYFLAQQEYQAALGMVFVWLLGRGLISVADVFYSFATERPLVAQNPFEAPEGRAPLIAAKPKVEKNTEKNAVDLAQFRQLLATEYRNAA